MNSESIETVLVGIVAYNTAIETLTDTLKSLLVSVHPIHVVVLCNSPEEDYQQQVISICCQLKVTCLDHQPNEGFGAAHNRITKSSTFDWYICCNPDIVASPTAVESLLAFAKERPDAVLLTPKVIYPDGKIQPIARRHLTLLTWVHRQLWRVFPRIFTPYEIKFNYQISQPTEFVSGCFFLIKLKKFIDLKGFDEGFFLYAEDADLSWRASLVGTNYYVADSEVVHVWSTQIVNNPKAVLREIRSLTYYFWKRIKNQNLLDKNAAKNSPAVIGDVR